MVTRLYILNSSDRRTVHMVVLLAFHKDEQYIDKGYIVTYGKSFAFPALFILT